MTETDQVALVEAVRPDGSRRKFALGGVVGREKQEEPPSGARPGRGDVPAEAGAGRGAGRTGPSDGFIDPVPMEEDPAELFAGDAGTLDAEVRRVLVRLLQRRFLMAERNPAQWRTLLENQQVIESRLHDLFVHLVVDHDRGIAYKKQVRSAELDVPIMLKDDPYSRAETLVLVHLRTVFQREQGAGSLGPGRRRGGRAERADVLRP